MRVYGPDWAKQAMMPNWPGNFQVAAKCLAKDRRGGISTRQWRNDDWERCLPGARNESTYLAARESGCAQEGQGERPREPTGPQGGDSRRGPLALALLGTNPRHTPNLPFTFHAHPRQWTLDHHGHIPATRSRPTLEIRRAKRQFDVRKRVPVPLGWRPQVPHRAQSANTLNQTT